MQVVYADVLIILNTYVNFFLLRLVSFVSKKQANRLRLTLSAIFGGIYSLIILIDDMPQILSIALKTAASAFMVLIAFGYVSFNTYIKRLLSFLFVTFVFAGLMFSLWLFVKPETMLYNNATVYFQFDTLTLLVATTSCYVILRLIYRVIEIKAPKGHIYEITVYIDNKEIRCSALLDSGSSLKDYFTALPIIVVDRRLFPFLPDDILKIPHELKPKYVPVNTVSGDGLMLVVKPDKVRIKGTDYDLQTESVLIGLSNSKIKNGDFEAILPYETVKTEGEIKECSHL